MKNVKGMLELLRLNLRNLRQRKAHTILTIIGVMVGVAAMISVSTLDETSQRSIDDTFDQAAGNADLIVTNATASIGDTAGFDADTLVTVRSTPGIKLAAPLMQLTTLSSQELTDWEWDFYSTTIDSTLLYGIDPESSSAIGHYYVSSGEDLDESSGNDALVSKSYAHSLGIGLGDTLRLVIPSGMADFKIVGMIDSRGLARLNSGKVVLTHLDTIAEITSRIGKLDQIDVMADDGIGPARLKYVLQIDLGPRFSVTPPEVKGEQVDDMARQIASGLNYTAWGIIFIGVLLILNSFTATMVERRREMGLMRAIGAGRGHLIGMVLGEACLLGLVGTLLGIPLGVGLAQGFGKLIEETTKTQMNTPTILPEHLILAFLVGIGVAIIASVIPAIQLGRLTPLESIRIIQMESVERHHEFVKVQSRTQVVMGTMLLLIVFGVLICDLFGSSDISFRLMGWIVEASAIGVILVFSQFVSIVDRILTRLFSILGAYGVIGARNITRKPVRAALTVGILVLGISGIILSGGASDAKTKYHGEVLDKSMGCDLLVFSPQPYPQEIVRNINAMPGVAAATGQAYIPSKIVNQINFNDSAGTIIAFDPSVQDGTLWDMDWLEYSGSKEEALASVESESAVFIESYTAKHYGLNVGGYIRLRTLQGSERFKIAAVVHGHSLTGFVAMGGWETASKYYGTTNVNVIKIKLNKGSDPSVIGSDILDRWGGTYHLKVETYAHWYDRMINDIDEMNKSADLMEIIVIATVALAIANTLLMNASELRRELGMLQALGMTRRQLVGVICTEALGLGLLGGVIGIGLGLLLLPTYVNSFSSFLETGAQYPFVFPTRSLIFAIGIAILVPLTASLLPARQGTKTSIAEAMRTE